MISILLPFRNEEVYIKTCIDSIRNQTHTNWELLAVDDHSTDGSPQIVQDYAAADSRIHYIKNPGRGVIHALKTAHVHSRGTYLSRMDADDYKSTDNLASLMALANKGTLVLGQVKYFREDGLGEGYAKYETWINDVNREGRSWDEVYRECVVPSPCWLAHRDDFQACGGFDSPLYPEDYDLCFRFYRQGLTVRCTPNIIHFWRDHAIRTTRVSPHYADNRFTHLKVQYFFEIDRRTNQNLVLVGGGKKGKAVARMMQEFEPNFTWLTNNPNKVGHVIYDITMQDLDTYPFRDEEQVIIAVTGADESILNTHTNPDTYCFF